ncbi:MAG: hypothetical protein IKN39_02160 [Clostridia bacterium]|nr:hypothetical protein [Clostridia bacterium]
MKKVTAVILAVVLMALTLSSCKGKSGVLVLDGEGNTLAQISSFSKTDNDTFINAVLSEAVNAVADKQGLSRDKAQRFLVKNGCTIKTDFNKNAFEFIKEAYTKNLEDSVEYACVLTDTSGAVLAVYNNSPDSADNVTLLKNPYSTIKPLSVYSLALEEKIINWSSVFEDSEYKKIKGEDGNMYSWPANATNTYKNEDVTVEYAIKNSLNTVAVKCLSKLGVKKSLGFLATKLRIDVSQESVKAQAYGEEEIIGNIALGYLSSGVSLLDMAGYYQIFVNDGAYTPAHFVKEITDNSGKEIYKYSAEKTQVISGETANIMNNMLRQVVSPGATGHKAAVKNLEIAGKTGTGNDYEGNWFIGASPDYICAVWHGRYMQENIAPQIFSGIFSKLKHENTRFKSYQGIKKAGYCAESGKLLSAGCTKMETGFYTPDNMPEKCDIHSR